MKFLFFLLSFAAIAAFGVTCVAPMLQAYIEGDVATDAIEEIEASKFADKYSVADLKMDHFHLKNVTLIPNNKIVSLDVYQIRKEIVGIVDSVRGVYAQDCEVILVNRNSEVATIPKENPDIEILKVGLPPPTETMDEASEREPASFSILWNAVENTLLLKGKQTNLHAGKELKKYFAEAQKQGTVTSNIEINNENVANSKYLSRVLRDIRLLIINSNDELSIDFQDAHKTNDGQKKGYLKFKGTTGTLEKYNALTSSIKNLESDDFEVQNELVFYPYVSIRKDAIKEKIILTGCVKDKIDLGTLGSNASRDVTNNFSTDNKLVTHKRCLNINWHDEYAENIIARHMNKVVDGEIIYRNNKLYSLSGVSHDADYVDEVRQAFKGKNIAQKLIYEEVPRKQISLVEPEPARPETLGEQLNEYQIYFGSGKSKVDPRYSALLDDIASKIKTSIDKTSQIIVGGYADASGSAPHNKSLSLKRARSVVTKLVSRGVDAERIQVEFLGAETSAKPKAESRRVEIKVRKK